MEIAYGCNKFYECLLKIILSYSLQVDQKWYTNKSYGEMFKPLHDLDAELD